MQKRLLLFFAILLFSHVGIQAQSYLVVNGNKSFTLSDVQKITFANGNMVVTSTSSSDSFALSSLNGFKFSDTAITTSNENLEASGMKVVVTNSTLYVSGAAGSLASIYTIGGAILYSQILTPESAITIGGFPSGIYILKVNGTSFKFMKR